MRERAEMAGGRCTLYSLPAPAPRLEVWVPPVRPERIGRRRRARARRGVPARTAGLTLDAAGDATRAAPGGGPRSVSDVADRQLSASPSSSARPGVRLRMPSVSSSSRCRL